MKNKEDITSQIKRYNDSLNKVKSDDYNHSDKEYQIDLLTNQIKVLEWVLHPKLKYKDTYEYILLKREEEYQLRNNK